MSTMDAIKSLGLTTSVSANKAKAKSTTLDQEEFLKLMTTQMTHQDPTKPMQNGEFLSQMAQFGTVSGIQDLQKSFNDFATSISSDQALQATGLIGRTVSLPSNEALLPSGGKINGSVNLSSSSPTVTLKILDPATGDVVATRSLGGQSSGPVAFEWDGTKANGIPAGPGVYKIQVEALQDGVNTILQPNIQAKVDSVSMANDVHGLQVNVKGLGAFNFNKVTQILNQES
jgi:flagellar basal-body rod modification protein FlgD